MTQHTDSAEEAQKIEASLEVLDQRLALLRGTRMHSAGRMPATPHRTRDTTTRSRQSDS